MNKKDSLKFLQSCIDMIESASEEDVQMFQKKYERHCIEPKTFPEFELIPPVDLDPVKVECVEKSTMILPESSILQEHSEMKQIYYFGKLQIKNSQEIENAAFAA